MILSNFLFRNFTLTSFQTTAAYRRFVLEGLSSTLNPFKEAIGSVLLGTEDFLERLKARIIKQKAQRYHGQDTLFRKPFPDVLRQCEGYPRNLRIYLLSKYARVTQKQVGEKFDISNTAVSQTVRRVEARLVNDKAMKQRVEDFSRKMSNVNNWHLFCKR